MAHCSLVLAGLERAQAERVGGSRQLDVVRDEVEPRDLKAGRARELDGVKPARPAVEPPECRHGVIRA